jgi:dolichol-phosphate mannosyltransferase
LNHRGIYKTNTSLALSVVIPCYKVKSHILKLISNIGSEINLIYIVDDCCPESSGKYVEENCDDKRVKVMYNDSNKGVGGAVITGYKQAIEDGAEIVIKLDGDGQMDARLIPDLIRAIINGEADYCKGNRFFNIDKLLVMPKLRLFGNSALSLVNKMVNGYWNIVDPTNGFTAIHSTVLKRLPLEKIDNRYFFESDMLFRLSIIKAVVKDFPMDAIYSDEKSNLKIREVLLLFPAKYFHRFLKRIFYNYLLRDCNAGSIQLFLGFLLFLFGSLFGIYHWILSYESSAVASSGTVMLAALPLILGFQLLIGALNYDVQNIPKIPLQKDRNESMS